MKIDSLSRAQLSIINKNNYRYPLAEAEKDYFLAIVLEILYSSKLKDTLVFKGGTALHHLYLDQLRFSEDLDFGAIREVALSDIEEVFATYDFLEVKKASPSDHTLKIDRLKFEGPLGQPNSLKIDIDLTQDILLPVQTRTYHNVYRVGVSVRSMDLIEICAEKARAANERARYRDFYDLTAVIGKLGIEPEMVVSILKKKELRKPLSAESILENFQIAQTARNHGLENLFYREEIKKSEIKRVLDKIIPLI